MEGYSNIKCFLLLPSSASEVLAMHAIRLDVYLKPE